MGAQRSGNRRWSRTALMGTVVVVWQLYDLASATEAPSRAVLMLNYFFLAGGLIAVAGSLIAYLRTE